MALDSRLIVLSVMALLGFACSAPALTLVKDGQPASVIVLAQDSTASAKAGAEELQYHIKKMSGADLQVVTADKVPSDAATALILIGRSALTDKLGVDLSTVPAEGYLIKTVGNALVLAGDDAGGEGKSAADIMGGTSAAVRSSPCTDCFRITWASAGSGRAPPERASRNAPRSKWPRWTFRTPPPWSAAICAW